MVNQPTDVDDETSDSEGDEVAAEQIIVANERNCSTSMTADMTTVPAQDVTQKKRTISMEDKPTKAAILLMCT